MRNGQPWGLATRLVGVFALVIAAAAVTAWGIAAAIGPQVFHQHMVAAGVEEDHPAIVHAEQAFRSASATSLAVALAVAVVAALALSMAVTRRVSRSLGELASAARRVAGGEFDLIVDASGDASGLGREFAAVTGAFTDMAADLAESQALRDRLVADVAHELRTPVATISAYLEAIEDGVAALTPETIGVLRQQSERLTRLAQDLLVAYRAEHGDVPLDLELVPVVDLLDHAAAAARPTYQAKGVDVVVHAAPDLWVDVDRARCGQALANLVDNALRHTPPGGRVTMSARADGGKLGGKLRSTSGRADRDGGAARSGGVVVIEVADSGDGIAPEHLPHVFERFYRVDTARDRAHGGFGIGLAIAKALTVAHGGTLTAASGGAGRGAVFTLTLPAHSVPN